MMNHFIFFLVFILGSSFTTTSTLDCPDAKLILPCQCSSFPIKKIQCNDVSSLIFVRNLLEEHIGNESFERLYLKGVNSFSLPARALGNLSPIKLSLMDSNIRHIDDKAFQNQRLLTFLNLYNCRLQEIPIGALKHISNLQTLAIVKNFLMRIPSGLLNTLTNLEFLILSNNRLSIIDKDAFPKHLNILSLSRNLLYTLNGSLHSLSDLDELMLTDNRLTNIEGELDDLIKLRILLLDRNYLTDISKSFVGLQMLTDLSLSGNKIQKIGKSLNDLSNLKYLNLSHNYIAEINWKTFEKMKQLRFLDLSGNYLKVICPFLRPLKSLENLFLSDLNLKILEPDCFHSMKMLRKLDVSYNRLTDVEAVFQHPLPNIYYLSLDHNRLSHFDYDMKYLKNLRYLDLGFNNISSFKEDIFAQNRQLRILRIDGNSWKCTDEMLYILEDLETRNVDVEGQPDC